PASSSETKSWAARARPGFTASKSSSSHDVNRLGACVSRARRRGEVEVRPTVPEAEQRLDAWPEPGLAELGLFSPVRQALVYRHTRDHVLLPALHAVGLPPEPIQKR